jgi:hypothetical protein
MNSISNRNEASARDAAAMKRPPRQHGGPFRAIGMPLAQAKNGRARSYHVENPCFCGFFAAYPQKIAFFQRF